MGVILSDLTRADHDLQCNGWNWRPTLAAIDQSGIFDTDRLQRMAVNGGGAEVTREEARRVADYISAQVLPKMREKDEVKMDGRISDKPRWRGLFSERPSHESLYGASRRWLEEFVTLCRECAASSSTDIAAMSKRDGRGVKRP